MPLRGGALRLALLSPSGRQCRVGTVVLSGGFGLSKACSSKCGQQVTGRQGAALCPTPAVVSACDLQESPNSAAPPTQVELASILKFVLDNEECLNENLEPFLQRKGKCWVLAFPPVCAAVAARFQLHHPDALSYKAVLCKLQE